LRPQRSLFYFPLSPCFERGQSKCSPSYTKWGGGRGKRKKKGSKEREKWRQEASIVGHCNVFVCLYQ
jgi:hypothetical protein